MILEELEIEVSIALNQFRVKYKQISLNRNTVTQFIVDDFGLVISCIDRLDYTQISDSVFNSYENWRYMYITTEDRMLEKRFEILWSLMRGGYMRWLRFNYPRQVRSILLGHDSLGKRIIEERLRLWNNKPKHIFLIEDNKAVLRNGILRELSDDPGFFDYMPEEENDA